MASSPVIYQPADILNWVRLGAESLRALPGMDERGDGMGEAVRDVFDRALGVGKGAFAGFGGKGIEKLEYRILDERFELSGLGPTKSIAYADVKKIDVGKRGSARIGLVRGSASIRPYAWIVVAGVRLPMGWLRNGMEVGYETLIHEIAARAKIDIAS